MKKKLILIFILILLLKIFLSFLITTPLGFSDSLSYILEAKIFFDYQDILTIAELKQIPLLYPVVISPAFFSNNMEIVFQIILIINCILSTLIIIPSYLLAKEFFNKKTSLLIATIIMFLSPIFTFSFVPLSENLFFLLTMFFIYYLYRAIKYNTIKDNIFAGLFLGLCFLTKIIALTLVIGTILLIFFYRKQLKQKIYLLITAFLVSLFWIIPRIIDKGNSVARVIGYQNTLERLTIHLNPLYNFIWIFLYLDYIIIGLGIISFIGIILLLTNYKILNADEKLIIKISFILSLCILVIAANHSMGTTSYDQYKIIGRYVESLFPLLFIIGAIGLAKIKKFSWFLSTIFFIFTMITTYLLLKNINNRFFPINNSSWTHIGIINQLFSTYAITVILIILITIWAISIVMIQRLKFKNILYTILIYFIILSLISTAVIVYNSEYILKETDPIQMGHWLNNNIPKDKTVLFYKEEYEIEIKENTPITLAAAQWLRGDYILDYTNTTQNYDYIITKEELDYEQIHSINSLKVYITPK